MRRVANRVADLPMLIARVPKEIDDAVRARAAQSGRSINAELVFILGDALGIDGVQSGLWSVQGRVNLRLGNSNVG